MNTYLHIVIQFSDMSELKNNCSVLTVATSNFIQGDGQQGDVCTEGKFLMLRIVWFSIFQRLHG